ncbi:MAG: PEP-CTERM sorting domain-containing protein [Verrucomicrobiota bacterium]
MKKSNLIASLAISSAFLIPAMESSAQTLFSDNFDVNTSAIYTVNKDADTEALFNYDYSLMGIPSAPNSAGTTFGVRFRANYGDATAAAAAINISPTGAIFAGDYKLRYDLWINPNGPFPGGGPGSTEFSTGGVGNSGLSVQKNITTTTGPATGPWFAVDGEGGSTSDFRAYRGVNLEAGTSAAYAATDDAFNRRDSANGYYLGTFPGGQQAPAFQQTTYPTNQTGALAAGTIGFGWRQVEIAKIGTNVTWTIDGLLIATLNNATFSGSNIFVGHWDAFSSIADNAELNFSVIDNLQVEAIPEPSTIALGVLGAAGLFFAARRKR